MNLRAADLLSILLGGIAGAAVGWLVSFLLKPGTFPETENVIGLRGVGLAYGAAAGMAVAVLTRLFRSVRDPAAEPSRNFSRINGIGSTLLGRSDVADDDSYSTTEWFTVLYVPIFPVCRYRVTEVARNTCTIHAKSPPRGRDVAKVYGLTALALGALVGTLYLISRNLYPS